MEQRTELILNTIIKEHIKTGAPVGSGVLVDKYRLDISPATVRNEMVVLEDDGYIVQPHTSAGRVPTEKAYRLYLHNLPEKKISEAEQALLQESLSIADEIGFKQTAKALAKISHNAVFWAFHKHNIYYTGISNLFSQPEFANSALIYDISAVIDRTDEIIDEIYNEIGFNVQTLLGKENPFGGFCSSVVTKYKKTGNVGMFGVIAPMRMNYEKTIAAVKFIKENIR